MRRITALFIVTLLTTAAAAGPASAGPSNDVSGDFTVAVDFASLSLAPVGAGCALTVDVELMFGGSLEGSAHGVTSALVFASCDDVATNPPGTFSDLFRADLQFDGVFAGNGISADIVYQGRTATGGGISGLMVFSGEISGAATVTAILGVGGSHSGIIVTR